MEIVLILGILLILGVFKYKPRKFGFKPRSVDSVEDPQGEESRRSLHIRRRRASSTLFAKSGSRSSRRVMILVFLLFAGFLLVYTLKLI